MPDWGSFGRQRLYFVDPTEPAPLFNNRRAEYTQVVNLDDFRVPDLHHSPVIDARWDILGVPEAEENDDHVCPSILPPEAVRDAQNALTVPAHDHHDEAVRLPPRGLINAPWFHAFPQPVDTWWQSLRRQQGHDFAQRDALRINVGGNYVDNPVDDECQEYFTESDIEISSQKQRPTTTQPASATTTVNSAGVDLRQHKEIRVDPTKSTQQTKKRCIAKSVLGLRKAVNARMKKKAPTARRPAWQRRSHILLERERRQAMSALYDTLRELFQLENSEISARTDKATVVLEATNRIVSLEARVKEILEELKTTRRSRNFSPAMPPATATAAPAAPAPPPATAAALPSLVRPQSYFSANVRLDVSGLGQMWITIHSPEEARQLHRLFLQLVTRVTNASRNHLADMVHLNVSTVAFATFYTLHCQTTPGSDFAVDELHTTLQMVVNCEQIMRLQASMNSTVNSNSENLFQSGTREGYTRQL